MTRRSLGPRLHDLDAARPSPQPKERPNLLQFSTLVFERQADRDEGRPTRTRPIVVANPPADRAFRSTIDRFLASGSGGPEDLEDVLRVRYPQAVVRRRDLTGERVEVWYAYRDGHWIRSEDDAPGR